MAAYRLAGWLFSLCVGCARLLGLIGPGGRHGRRARRCAALIVAGAATLSAVPRVRGQASAMLDWAARGEGAVVATHENLVVVEITHGYPQLFTYRAVFSAFQGSTALNDAGSLQGLAEKAGQGKVRKGPLVAALNEFRGAKTTAAARAGRAQLAAWYKQHKRSKFAAAVANAIAPRMAGILVPISSNGTITISQYKDGVATGEFAYVYVEHQSPLTLSLGALLSGVQDRTYVARLLPSGSTVLGVPGATSPTLEGVALLNYDVPSLDSDAGRFGFAVSSGPTFNFGGSPQGTSALGYFAGGSIYLWHRLFLSVGGHVADFADFPGGFGEGATIPSGAGSLQPTSRWTVKFGFAISYQTKSFGSGGQPAPPAAPAAKGTPKQ